MKPPITTLSPVWTKERVLMLDSAGSVRVVAVMAITRTLVSHTRQTTRNNDRRGSFFILEGLRLIVFALDRFAIISLRNLDCVKQPFACGSIRKACQSELLRETPNGLASRTLANGEGQCQHNFDSSSQTPSALK